MVRTIVYGLIASFLLFSLSVAIQRTFLGEAVKPGHPESEPSRTGHRPSTSAAASRPPVSDEAASSDDPEAPFSDPHIGGKTRGGVRQRPEDMPHQTQPARPRIERATAWSNPLSPPSSLISSGSRGAVGAPPSVTPSTASSSPGSGGSNGVQVREVFYGTSEASACQPGGWQFALHALHDLYVCVVWSGLAGTYAEQLTFVAPDGNVYQTVTVAFVTAGATPPADGIVVRGRQLAVQPAGWGANGETLVIARLPVGGTFISQYTLLGLWTVKVSLSGTLRAQNNFELLSQ